MNYKLLLFFILLNTIGFTQTQGFIEYDIEIKGLTPEINKGAAMLTNSSMRVSFIDSAIRQDYTMGAIIKKTTILNYAMNQGIYYEDGVNGKFGVFGSCDQINQLIVVDTNVDVELTKEKKTILTFTCYKAIMRLKSGEQVEYWYTNQFPVKLPQTGFFNPNIPGVILEFSTTSNGFFMRFKCSNYGEDLTEVEKLFDPRITRDYKMIEFNSYMQYLYLQKQQKPK